MCRTGLYLRSVGSVNLQSAIEAVKSNLNAQDQSGWITNPSDVELARIGIGVCRNAKNIEVVCVGGCMLWMCVFVRGGICVSVTVVSLHFCECLCARRPRRLLRLTS